MAIQIKLKNSVVQDSTPSTSDLPVVGELALNANINSIGGFMRASDNTIVKIFGPGSVTTPTATTTVSGISELATNSETTTGTATNRVVTPAGLNAVTVAERTTSNTNYVAKAGSTLTGVLTMPNGSNSAPAINFGDSDSGIFGGTNTVSLAAGGTTRLTADTGVSVVGTLAVTGAITSTDDLTIPDKIIHSGDTNTAIRFPAADTVSVETGGSEALRVDSSQRLLIGSSTSVDVASSAASLLQVEHTSGNISAAFYSTVNSTGPSGTLALGHARGSASGILLEDDAMGHIRFAGGDGVDLETVGAQIAAEVDGTPGANDMPGRLVFSTTADGAASPTERLRIDSSGKIGINESSPLAKFHVKVADSGASAYAHCAAVFEDSDHTFIDIMSGTTGSGGINFGDSGGSQRGVVEYDHNSDFMRFIVAGGESIRMDSSGRVGINDSTPSKTLDITGQGGGNGEINVKRTSGATCMIQAQAATAVFGSSSNHKTQLKSNGTTALTIDTSQRVGIGTSAPTCPLQIDAGSGGDGTVTLLELNHGGNDTNDAVKLNFARAGSDIGSIALEKVASNNTTDFIFNTRVSNTVSESMRITGAGSLTVGGITNNGVASAFYDDLIINNSASGTGAGITLIANATNGFNAIDFADTAAGGRGRITYSHGDDDLRIDVNGTEAVRIASDGKVGIGDSTPNYELHVNDPSGTVSAIQLTNTTTGAGAGDGMLMYITGNNTIISNEEAGYMRFQTSGLERMLIDSSGTVSTTGNVSIGTTSPLTDAELTISATDTPALAFQRSGSGKFETAIAVESGHFFFKAGADSSTVAGLNDVFKIESNGNVGIGTTSPDSILDITSDTPLITLNSTVTNLGANNLVGAMKVFKSDASGSGTGICGGIFWRSEDSFGARTYIQFTNRQNSTGQTNTDTECMRIDGSGVVTFFKLKLGSGNDHDGAKLVIQGSGNNSGTNSIFIKNSDETPLFQVRNDGVIFTGTDGASPYNFTTSSAANVFVSSNGDLRRGGVSGLKYKKDIKDATWGLAEVLKLKPKTFKSNATGEFADDKTYAGFIAEDIHDLGLTEFVSYNDNNEPDALDYGNMVALMAKAIQELNAKVEALEAA